MRAVLAIAAKDLRQRVRDRSAIVMSVVAPFMLAYLFSVMIPSSSGSFTTTWAVADLDGGPVATALLSGPLEGVRTAGVATLVTVPSEAAARARVEQEGGAARVIPAGFSAAVQAGSAAGLTVIGDAAAPLSGQVLTSVLQGFAHDVEAVQVAVVTVARSAGRSPSPSEAAALAGAAAAMPRPVSLATAETEDRVASSATYYGASMAVLFVFLAAQFGGIGLHGERRGGTLARILAAPVSPRAILMGKSLVSLVLAAVSMTVIVVGTTVLLRASWGDPLAVALLVLAVSFAATGIALLVVGFTRTEDQASSFIAIVAMTLAVHGGSFFPMSQAPEILTRLSLLTPHGWFLLGINDLASGGGVAAILPSLLVLAAIGAVTGGLGLVRARRVVVPR